MSFWFIKPVEVMTWPPAAFVSEVRTPPSSLKPRGITFSAALSSNACPALSAHTAASATLDIAAVASSSGCSRQNSSRGLDRWVAWRAAVFKEAAVDL